MLLAHRLWPAQKSEKAKLLLLHGMGGTGALWRPIAAALEEDFSLLAPDQRGHGGSRPARAAAYTPLDFGQDLAETLEDLAFHPVIAVGHSMGVRSACALAHLRPEYVRGLVLVDLGLSGPAGGGIGAALAGFLGPLPERFSTRDDARAYLTQSCPDPSIVQYLMAVTVRDGDGYVFPFDKAALLETIRAAALPPPARDWVREYASPGRPVLVLRGERSLVFTRAEFERERAEFADLPSVVFEEVAGAGHGLPFEKRPEFVERVREFSSTP